MVAALVLGGITAVAILHATGTSCRLPAPPLNPPAALRDAGFAGAPLDSGDVAGLEETAQTAGQVLEHRDLLAATAAAPQREQAIHDDRNSATVVPLMVSVGGTRRVAALVVFLDDCQGNHYYSGIDDLAASTPPGQLATTFPAVTQSAAASRLGGTPQLAYEDDPAKPVWWEAVGGGTTPAT